MLVCHPPIGLSTALVSYVSDLEKALPQVNKLLIDKQTLLLIVTSTATCKVKIEGYRLLDKHSKLWYWKKFVLVRVYEDWQQDEQM